MAKAKAKPKKRKPVSKRGPTRPREVGFGEPLGDIVVPSGKVAIFDVGLMGYLPPDALAPAMIVVDVPRDPLPVYGRRVGKGRFAACWDSVVVPLGGGEPTHVKKLGEAGVDFARLILIDQASLDAWQHEDSLDGKADFVFWGRDAARYKAENKWLLATDLRPHSHHFEILAAARASTVGAGTLALGSSRALMFFTSWGDGVFPVYLDLDARDAAAQIRIQLASLPTAAGGTAR